MSKRKVHVVGGAGYIGSRLIPELINEGWEPEVHDVFMYQRAAHPDVKYPVRDVTKLDPPGDGAPVIWLASPHAHVQQKSAEWADMYDELQLCAPEAWENAGHELVMVSSMRALECSEGGMYAMWKCNMEGAFFGRKGVTILRFGTVWGSLDKFPARPQTVLNRALLGELPDENYSAYGTHIDEAVRALIGALEAPKLGEVRNCVDDEWQPYTRERLERFVGVGTHARNMALDSLWLQELQRTKEFLAHQPDKKFPEQPHPVELFARLYDLPWEEA